MAKVTEKNTKKEILEALRDELQSVTEQISTDIQSETVKFK